MRALWRRFLDWLVPARALSFREGDWSLQDQELLTGPKGVRNDIHAEFPRPVPTLLDMRGRDDR